MSRDDRRDQPAWARASWAGGMCFVNETGSGHAFLTDAPVKAGGRDSAPTPMEVVLAGLAACTGVDVVAILKKMKVPPVRLEVTAEADRAADHPRVFTAIRLHYEVVGDVPEKKLAKAISLSAHTYCSVSFMLGHDARIEHDYRIEPV